MRQTEEIIKMLNSIQGGYSLYDLYMDWVKCCAISIANTCTLPFNPVWKQREDEYLSIAAKYGENIIKTFSAMQIMLVNAYEEETSDILGEIFMSGGIGNSRLGQFFTPFHLSRLTSEISIDEMLEKYPDDEVIWMNEPSTGAGGMIIGVARALRDRGYNFQKKLKVVAQDLDWKAVYTTYVQLSWLGIDAIVVQGDTLQQPFKLGAHPPYNILRTPRNMGVLL